MSAYVRKLNTKDKQKHHAYMHALEVQPDIVILIFYSIFFVNLFSSKWLIHFSSSLRVINFHTPGSYEVFINVIELSTFSVANETSSG